MNVHDLGFRDVDHTQQGDTEAFTRLSSAHRERIRAASRRITGDDAGADEALAATLAEAWQHFDGSVDEQSFGRWLDRLATRSAWDVVRRRWRLTLASRPSYPPHLVG